MYQNNIRKAGCINLNISILISLYFEDKFYFEIHYLHSSLLISDQFQSTNLKCLHKLHCTIFAYLILDNIGSMLLLLAVILVAVENLFAHYLSVNVKYKIFTRI